MRIANQTIKLMNRDNYIRNGKHILAEGAMPSPGAAYYQDADFTQPTGQEPNAGNPYQPEFRSYEPTDPTGTKGASGISTLTGGFGGVPETGGVTGMPLPPGAGGGTGMPLPPGVGGVTDFPLPPGTGGGEEGDIGVHQSRKRTIDPEERDTVTEVASECCVGWLLVVAGPERGVSKELRSAWNDVGRSEAAEVCLHGDSQISRRQIRVNYVDKFNRYYIVPHSEASGNSFVNGEALLSQRELKAGDIIELGRETELRFIPACDKDFVWCPAGSKKSWRTWDEEAEN